ncbi:MAG: iron-containing alcohol dehydrogenase, partial [Spirochaetales bacterium]
MRVMRHLPDTRLLASRHRLIESVPVLLKRLAPGKTPFVVCDEHTWDAAGSRLQEILAAAGAPRPAQPLKLTSPEDDYKFAEKVAVSISAAGTNPEDVIPLAVGSGTITDVVRLGSFLAGIRFISIPTAPSMDGYASAGSPVMKDGFKKTIQCRGPLAVLTDLDIAAGAPRHLAAAGTGDLLGKITAGADWLTAHRLGLEPVDRGVFTFVQKPVRGLIKYLLR